MCECVLRLTLCWPSATENLQKIELNDNLLLFDCALVADFDFDFFSSVFASCFIGISKFTTLLSTTDFLVLFADKS